MVTSLLLFLITVISLIIVPGPDMLYVTSRALANGRESGLKAAIGISAGYLVFTALVGVGLGAVFDLYPEVFLAFKILGMLYLFYLAYQLYVADLVSFARNSENDTQALDEIKFGFLTSVLNPKGLVFYFALLAQFYTPGVLPFYGHAVIFGTITSLLCFLIYSSVGLIASGKGHQLLMSTRNGKTIARIASLFVFLIALSLILSDVFEGIGFDDFSSTFMRP